MHTQDGMSAEPTSGPSDGNLTDEKTREEIADVLAALRDWIGALA